jgi:hypothetical protein
MEAHQFGTPIGPAPEIGIEGNARKFALEVLRIFFAVNGIVQDAVDVMKNVVLGDVALSLVFACLVMGAELFQRPVGDVVEAVAV